MYISACQDKDAKILKVESYPLDTIQCFSWDKDPNKPMFAAGGWDCFLRIYMVNFSPLEVSQVDAYYLDEPIISCSMTRDYIVFSGHIDGNIRMVNLQTKQVGMFARHNAAIRDVYWIDQMNILVSFGFDQVMNFWDPNNNVSPVFTVNLQYKTVATAFDYPYVLICSEGERYSVIKIDQPNLINQPRYYDCHLGPSSKILSCDINAKTKGWLIATVDGRGNYGTFYDLPNNQVDPSNSVVCFKAQKKEEYVKNFLLQVNSCGFNPERPEVIFVAGGQPSITFFTAQKNGDKIKQYKYRASVTAARLSPNGKLLAYALGYDWTSGIAGLGKADPRIYVHIIGSDDLQKI